MLGSASEAEDAIHDAYLRWDAADRTAARGPEPPRGPCGEDLSWMSRDVPNLETVETDVNVQPGILAIMDGALHLAIVLDVADGLVGDDPHRRGPRQLSYLSAHLR